MVTTKVYYAGGRPPVLRDRVRDERGEGVISAAIAVLVMSFIGVAIRHG